MELNFLGRGAMLYPSEGNTAAYFEEGNNLFLFDCGEDVAAKLIKDGKLTRDTEVYLFITHTHSDHIGSLGTLQQYLYWVCGKKLNIVIDYNLEYMIEIKAILRGFGLEPSTYNFVLERDLDNKFESFNQIRYMKSNHGDIPIGSASIIMKTNQGNILYSGDIADSRIIKYFIQVSEGFIDRMYIDTSYTDSPVHLSIHKLNEVIPEELKHKVYCMHINNKDILPIIEEYGFNLVGLKGRDLLTRDMDTMTDEELRLLGEMLERKLGMVREKIEDENKLLKN